MLILAIDPGVSTGVAIKLDDTYNTMTIRETQENMVWDLLAQAPWDCVIYETFATSGRISGYGLHTVRLVGGIEALCYIKGYSTSKQQPAFRRSHLDASAKLLTNMAKPFTEHEKDAMAHLLKWEYTNNQPTTKGKLHLVKG